MNGQLISEVTATSNDYEISTANLADGMYIARIIIENKVETIKFTK